MTPVAPPARPDSSVDPFAPRLRSGIDALILLGGTVRQTDLRRAIGRHILQLPINPERTILTHWADQVAAIAQRLDVAPIPLRILLSPEEIFNPEMPPGNGPAISVETDPQATRGTGGVLRDLVTTVPDDRWLLVANANQAFVGDPAEAIRRLAATGADMALMPAVDRNGGFLLLTRCACLKGIASRGFVDLKEQALPAIAQRFDVRVVDASDQLTPTSIRSLHDYLHLLAELSRRAAGVDDETVCDEWAHGFRIVEPRATVAPDARVHNSVVLAGAVVESGAVVARCIIGPDGRVRSGEVVRDRLVSPAIEEAAT